jgi:hypothetical protein
MTAAADPNAAGGLRARPETTALALAARGIRATIVRLPPSVHHETQQGLDIAETIGRSLGVQVAGLSPQDASKHFGWLAPLIGTDNPVSSQAMRERLRWQPTRPGLIVDTATALGNTGADSKLR